MADLFGPLALSQPPLNLGPQLFLRPASRRGVSAAHDQGQRLGGRKDRWFRQRFGQPAPPDQVLPSLLLDCKGQGPVAPVGAQIAQHPCQVPGRREEHQRPTLGGEGGEQLPTRLGVGRQLVQIDEALGRQARDDQGRDGQRRPRYGHHGHAGLEGGADQCPAALRGAGRAVAKEQGGVALLQQTERRLAVGQGQERRSDGLLLQQAPGRRLILGQDEGNLLQDAARPRGHVFRRISGHADDIEAGHG